MMCRAWWLSWRLAGTLLLPGAAFFLHLPH